MAIDNTDFSSRKDSLDQNQQLRRVFFRIIPFWPLIIFVIITCLLGAYIYLRYAIPVYEANARIIVNDDSQEKNANLLEAFKIDTRNLTNETERELEVLSSKDLLRQLVIKLQLNVQYSQKGFVRDGQFYDNIPVEIELIEPDSIRSRFFGEVKVINGKVSFANEIYPVDTLVKTRFGHVRWHINKEYNNVSPEKVFLTVLPVSSTVGGIKNALSIKPISKQSTILELTYKDEIPDRGVTILDTLISLYGSTTTDYKRRISDNTRQFLDERLRLVSDQLGGVEKNLQSFKSSQGITDLGAEGTLFLDQLKQTDAKISELDVQLDVIKQIEQYVAKRNSSNSDVPATLGITDPVLTSLLDQLFRTEFDLEKLKQTSGSRNPQIEIYEQQIAKLKPSISASLNNLKLSMTASRARLQSDNERLTARLGKIPQKERVLVDISREQGIKNAIYTFLLQKREESAINAASIVANYRLIEKAESAGIVQPVSKRVYTISIILAIILIIIYIYFREFSNSRLLFRTQIESRISAPIVGELVYQQNENKSPVVVGAGKRTLIAEQFRELRTNLTYIAASTNGPNKIILITSSIPNEGKSFVAINTSISICLTGSKVVLLEFDLRKPKISSVLGVNRDPGLSTYLIGKATAAEIIQPHADIANFSIIPSGPVPPNPAELISTPRLAALMDYLKQHFDYIIIDSPPVASVTDAKILAGTADITLYIVRHNYTDISFLQLINENYQKKTFPNLNIVFNGIGNKKIIGYGYGYGKGFGYGYGYGYVYGYGYGYGYTENPRKKSS